jgi:hypothetical protein
MRLTGSIVIVVLALPAATLAREVPVRTALVVRARPSTTAAIVDRVAAGQKVQLLGRSGDWAHVRDRGHEGWTTAAMLELPPEPAHEAAPLAAAAGAARAEPEAPSLAPAKPLHPEAWVARSSYHDGGARAVAIARATLRARPSLDARALGEIAVGEELAVVRRSADGAWWMVDSGANEVAWVEASALDEKHRAVAPTVPTRVAAPTPEPDEPRAAGSTALVAQAPPVTRKSAIALGAGAGVAFLSRRFTSDGTAPFSSFVLSTTALDVTAAASFVRAQGRFFRWGIDAAYSYVGASNVKWRAPDGSDTFLDVTSHQVNAGLSAGVHFAAAGGIELRARAGGRLDVNVLDGSSVVHLPSDRLVGFNVGLGLELPRLAAPGGHAIGLHASGVGLVWGQRSENVDEGQDVGSWGLRAGGGVTLSLWQNDDRGRLVASADYAYDLTVTHLSGPSLRDPTASHGTLGTEQHLATLALVYAY